MSLINERGLVHRIWAFDYDEFLKLCDYISMNYKFRLLPEIIPQSMSPKENDKTEEQWDKIYPIYHDLNALWKIIQNYVTNFFRINYHISTGNDNLPNDLPMRRFINEICEQLGIAGITSLRHFIDVLSQYSQILVLAVVTGLRMPGLLEDWSHLIDHDQNYQDNLKNYKKFKRDLQDLSEDIDRRNEIRNYPFQSFNPKYMECSTSV
jgi:hypothetical protein